ncbi:YdeI/OmpD-associated family protein [Mucilaginibacter sp.]
MALPPARAIPACRQAGAYTARALATGRYSFLSLTQNPRHCLDPLSCAAEERVVERSKDRVSRLHERHWRKCLLTPNALRCSALSLASRKEGKKNISFNVQPLFPAQQKRGQVKRLSENRVSQNASKISKGFSKSPPFIIFDQPNCTITMSSMNPKVDFYFNKAKQWQEEYERLRMIILDCQLTEELKWGCPCYTFQGKNIVLIHGFKEYCALLFFKGVLLNDPNGILIQQTENVQVGRQIRFTNLRQIIDMEPILKAYIHEAIEVEKSGLNVELKKVTEFKIAAEFQDKLNHIPALKTAFEALTPGRQRAYLLHFSAPKQSKTRESRVEKYMPQILNGKGLDD